MKKAGSLKELLLASVPALHNDPARLALFVDKGSVASVRSGSLSFELAYTLTIWVEAFAGDLDTLFVPILAWISKHQPDLIARPDGKPFTFESELLDGDSADITIDIELTERVLVERRTNGKLRTVHRDDEPQDAMFGEDAGPTGWRGILDDVTGGEQTAA